MLETIRLLRRELDGRVPLIGFGGAPFTLAAYAIEGGPSRDYLRTKTFHVRAARGWHRLCALFADSMTTYLRAQVGSRRASAPDLRFVGRRARPRRLSRVRAPAHEAHLRRPRQRGCAAHPFRRRRDRDSSRSRRSRRPRHRRRLAPGPRRRVEDDRPVARHSGQSRSGATVRATRSPARCRRRHPATGPAAAPDISSISATACCRQTPVESLQALADHVHARTRART